MTFHRGDRVKLISRVAMHVAHSKRKLRVDWLARRGTVSSTPRGSNVVVRWDGRKFNDNWPKTALEHVDE
jgi:hypothetical protein